MLLLSHHLELELLLSAITENNFVQLSGTCTVHMGHKAGLLSWADWSWLTKLECTLMAQGICRKAISIKYYAHKTVGEKSAWSCFLMKIKNIPKLLHVAQKHLARGGVTLQGEPQNSGFRLYVPWNSESPLKYVGILYNKLNNSGKVAASLKDL